MLQAVEAAKHVADQIVDVFDSYRQSHQVLWHFQLGALDRRVGHLRLRGEGTAGKFLFTTVAESLAAVIVVNATGLADINWVGVLSIAGAAGLASLLTSIGNADFVAGEPAVVIEYTPEHSA